jgi:hypothetical protein
LNKQAHETILREALDDGKTMSESTLAWIITSNLRSDLVQWQPARHFDCCKDREAICGLWQKGFKTYFERSIKMAAPDKTEPLVLHNRRSALASFGLASHALADFYAHSNWVELWAAKKEYHRLAPLLKKACIPGDFPEGLQTGYFGIRYGIKGCPEKDGILQPPQGFDYCHGQLAKDYPDKGHGADRITSGGTTCFEVAMNLAIRATRELWKYWLDQIAQTHRGIGDIEAINNLLAWGKERTL